MKILLLSCCAPCCCAVIEKMARDGYDFAVAFYNPNIVPAAEYEKKRWRNLIKGLENEPERGRRCDVCFYMRLKRVMEYARENGFDAVASVLGVSRYKDLAQVNRAAQKASAECGVPYVEIEGRKGGMQDRRQLLIRELGLYAQDYCGCKPRVRETADKKTPEL